MKNILTYEQFILNEAISGKFVNEASIKTIALLFQNKGIRDAIKKEKVDIIRKSIEDEGISTKGVTDEEILQISKDLSESKTSIKSYSNESEMFEETDEQIKQEFANATLVRDDGDLQKGTEVRVDALDYSSKGDDEMVKIVKPNGELSEILKGNLKVQI